MKKNYKQVMIDPSKINLLPELNYYSTSKASITLHQGDKFYALTRVKDTNVDGEEFTIKNVYVADTREGINECFQSFVDRFPDPEEAFPLPDE